jgi:PKD repeat protein
LGKVYADFRNTLIYSTFIDTGSLDNQIRGRMVKAKKKRKMAVPRVIATLLIALLLFGGGYWLIKNKDILTGPGNVINIGKKGNPPVADFTISINKIYKDDEVKFIDKSVASNPGDVIKSRLWTIEKDGTVVMNSEDESITYAFDEKGDYRISLIAQDSRGVHSKPFTHNITVLEKPEYPYDDEVPDNSFDRK